MTIPDPKRSAAKATPFRKPLIANRGEVAVRIMRTARAMGLRTVAVHSDADACSPHVLLADEAVSIGGAAPAESYLRVEAIIDAARRTGADAIHPGYGFLAENPALPEACSDAGIVFVGPSADAIRAMGDKARAKALMAEAGVPCIPGHQGERQDAVTLAAEAARIGYPVMIKATAGGGGRGMRLVEDAASFADFLASAKSEAMAAFGDDTVLLERAVRNPRHIEIQILADRHGNVIHLAERDCSVQRRHQKLIEEAPSPALTPELRERMGAAAVTAAASIGYEGAGTLEFLLDEDGAYYFMEMNTRLQVEHPVTEAVTGLDLVRLQLQIAAGEPLPIRQEDVRIRGHAIEVRLCAEDPEAGFLPQSGTLALWEPSGLLRVEHALASGVPIVPYYDSMIAKLVSHGSDREEARRRLLRGLEDTVALGVRTNQRFLTDCLAHPDFNAGEVTTAFVAQNLHALVPDVEDAEILAACRLAALMRGAPAVALVSGFPAPLRLSRNGRVHDVLVTAAAEGRVFAQAADGKTLELRLQGSGATTIHYREDGVERSARLIVTGRRIDALLDGRTWDFEDVTFEPTPAAGAAAGDGRVRAAMNGRVVSVLVRTGDTVEPGQKVLVLEAMKMEHVHQARVGGRVGSVHVSAGDQVEANRILVEVEPG